MVAGVYAAAFINYVQVVVLELIPDVTAVLYRHRKQLRDIRVEANAT